LAVVNEVQATPAEPLPAIARFLNANGGVVGGGALLGDGLILTCAHVVNAALDRPIKGSERPSRDDLITVDFPLHDVAPAVTRVVTWRPLIGFGEGDLAGLEIVEGHPEIPAMRLVAWTLGTAGPLALFGFPRGEPMGVWKRSVLASGGLQGGWHQLSGPEPKDYKLQGGFSGCPVMRQGDSEVVAIFAQAEGTAEVDAGACIPVAKVVSTLAETDEGDRITRLVASSPTDVQGDDADRLNRLRPVLELPLGPDGGLPTVADVDMYDIGVSRSRYVTRTRPDPPYVRRSVDDELERVIDEEPFILLVGESKSGKSRTAFELLRRRRGSAAFVAPSGSPSAPVRLSEIGLPTSADRIVLWLDDVDRYLAPNGLDLRVLSGLEQHIPPMTVVATIQAKRREAVLRAEGEVGRIAKAVLDHAYTVTVPRLLRPAERTAAENAYPDEDFTSRGIGEQLVAAGEMERLYHDSRESEPRGWAVLQAAIDWRRAGIERPVPRENLRPLFAAYLFEATPEFDPSDESFDVGLNWARQRVAGTLALLQPVQVDSGVAYRAFDYIVAYADAQAHDTPDLPAPTWETVIDGVRRDELLTVAFEAFTRGNRTMAMKAAGRVREDDDQDTATAWAAVLLGDVEAEAGQYDAAEAYFREAMASNDPDVVRVAQLDLGSSLVNEGRLEEARALLEGSLASGSPEVVAVAQATLPAVLIGGDDSDRERARGLLESALVSGDPQVVTLAQANLSALLLAGDAEDRARAKELLQAALTSGNQQVVPLAQINLGALLMAGDPGDRARARELLETALEAGHPRVVPWANVNLAVLLMAGEPAERARAHELLEKALASGDARVVPQAQVYLAAMFLAGDDAERARARDLLEAVLAAGNPQTLTLAQTGLGGLLATGDADERTRGRQLLEAALASGDPRVLPLAQTNVAAMLIAGNPGDQARARELFEAALASGDPQATTLAQANLGGLLLSGDDADRARARELLEAALASGDPRVVPLAQTNLGAVLLAGDDAARARARELLESAVVSTDFRIVPLAQANLGVLLMDGDEADRARARELFETAAASGAPDAAPQAQDLLGDILADLGDVEGAAAAYEAAIGSGHPRWTPQAQLDLARLWVRVGDLAGARPLYEAVAGSDQPDLAPQAQDLLGDMLADLGDVEGAAAAYEAAIGSGHPRWTPQAQLDLAGLCHANGDVARARELLAAAGASGQAEAAADAQYRLGDLLAGQDNADAAVAAYEAAIASEHPIWAQAARIDLATLRWKAGDLDDACSLLLKASASDVPMVSSRAFAVLGDLRAYRGDTPGAHAAYNAASAAGDPDIAAAVQRRLDHPEASGDAAAAAQRARATFMD
jgi:tetratricopeptide (TPR) repeat protein